MKKILKNGQRIQILKCPRILYELLELESFLPFETYEKLLVLSKENTLKVYNPDDLTEFLVGACVIYSDNINLAKEVGSKKEFLILSKALVKELTDTEIALQEIKQEIKQNGRKENRSFRRKKGNNSGSN